eukprot:scaffold124853_cov30-Tisochrysis_lutea.AAC.1
MRRKVLRARYWTTRCLPAQNQMKRARKRQTRQPAVAVRTTAAVAAAAVAVARTQAAAAAAATIVVRTTAAAAVAAARRALRMRNKANMVI